MSFLSTFVGFLKRVTSLPGLATIGARRVIARMVSPALKKAGYRIAQIGTTLESAGIKYGEPEFTTDLVELAGKSEAEKLVPEALRGKLFPIENMVQAAMPSRYKYRGFAKGIFRDVDTGDFRESWISFYDNQRRSWEEWEDMVTSWYKISESGKTEELVSIDFQELRHNAKADY